MRTIEVAEFLAADPQATRIDEAFARHLRENRKHFNEIFAIKGDDRAVLAALVRRYKPRTIVETGTNAGCSSVIMALAAPDAVIYSFDIGEELPGPSQCTSRMFAYLFNDTPLAPRITARYASTFDLKPDSVPAADLWFIDSDHSYATVAHETNLALQNMASRGGVIVYHDAKPHGMAESDVARFLAEKFGDYTLINTRCGVACVEVCPAGGAAG